MIDRKMHTLLIIKHLQKTLRGMGVKLKPYKKGITRKELTGYYSYLVGLLNGIRDTAQESGK